MTEVKIFWLSNTGMEYIWEKSEKKNYRKSKKIHHSMSPGGRWKKVSAGYYIRESLNCEIEIINRMVSSLKKEGKKRIDVRNLFADLDSSELAEYPGHLLTVANLGADYNPQILWPIKKDNDKYNGMLQLWAYLCKTVPLPCALKGRYGLLLQAQDCVTAACWELSLFTAFGMRPKVCSFCETNIVIKGEKCPDCQGRKRPITARTRFLNRLAQYKKRGKITSEQRDLLKRILNNDGLDVAMLKLEKVLRK